MLDLFRGLVLAGIGLEVRQGALAVTAPVSPGSAPAVMARVRAHGAELRACVDDRVLRSLWHIPDEASIGPVLRTILAWLTLERAAFTAMDYRDWLAAKGEHVNAGALRYVADILAVEAVARVKLAAFHSATAANTSGSVQAAA